MSVRAKFVCGSISLSITNQEAAKQFEVGKSYYFDWVFGFCGGNASLNFQIRIQKFENRPNYSPKIELL